MVRGRKPKPTALRLLEGVGGQNAGHRALPVDEPSPARAARLPNAPAHLDDEGQREWRRMGKRLHRLGLFTEIDGPALTGYCQAWSMHVRATRELHENGILIATPNGHIQTSPFWTMAMQALEMMRKYLAEFGMSPSARTRVTKAEAAEADPFEDFLKSHGRAG